MTEHMGRKKQCMRCGHTWWPRVSNPKRCPSCKSRIWRNPRVTDPEEIKEISIYGDEHSHYGYHYHISTVPSFSQDKLLDLLENALKTILKTDIFDSVRHEWRGDNYRLTHDAVLRRKTDDPSYFELILRFSDPDHVHIFVFVDEGKNLLIQAIKQCFPNAAEFAIEDIDESDLDAMPERWRESRKYGG